jgi:hypothetical protein
MTTKNQAGYKSLYFAFLAGLCGNATFATLTTSEVQFSIFPLIALALVAYNWYQVYMTSAIESHISKSSLGLFAIGVLTYTTFVRMEYPELGSNFLPLMLVLGLSVWVAKTIGVFGPKVKA